MKIAVVGTGYVGSGRRRVPRRNGQRRHLRRQVDAKVRMLRRGRMPIYEPGLEELVQRNVKRKRLTFTTQLAKAVRASEIIFIAVGTPQGEDGSADLQHVLDVARDIAPCDERLQGHRRQEHRASRHGRQGARDHPARNHTPVQRRQQPRVPEAGRGRRGLPEARPRGHRRRRRHGAAHHAGAVRALHPHRRAGDGDGLRQRRAVQVRGKRAAGHQDLVHERDRQRLRALRRRRRRCAAGRGVGSAHRLVVPLPRRRLRRQLLSQGRQGHPPFLRHKKATSSRFSRRSRPSTSGRSRAWWTRW